MSVGESHLPAFDPTPLLPAEIPPGARCAKCAYDLAGLSPSGLCPECAHPIPRSILPRHTWPEMHAAASAALTCVVVATCLSAFALFGLVMSFAFSAMWFGIAAICTAYAVINAARVMAVTHQAPAASAITPWAVASAACAILTPFAAYAAGALRDLEWTPAALVCGLLLSTVARNHSISRAAHQLRRAWGITSPRPEPTPHSRFVSPLDGCNFVHALCILATIATGAMRSPLIVLFGMLSVLAWIAATIAWIVTLFALSRGR